MKKTIASVLGVILLLCALYLIVPGFTRCGSAFIQDYRVSGNGDEMTITVGVGSSVGYVRKVSVRRQEDGVLYLDFINAFGGINGSIGARSEYVVPLDNAVQSICLYRSDGSYEAILKKDELGEWNRQE